MSKKIGMTSLIAILVMAIAVPGFAQERKVGPVPDDALEEIFGIKSETTTYIVQLIGDPVVSYDGDIQGLPATAPGRGQKINPNNGAVRNYVRYLNGQHADVIASSGAQEKLYDYVYSFNGFAAVLTPVQAIAVVKHPNVQMIWPDEARQLETNNTPSFLGLSDDGGLWDMGYDGEDIIIGVIDTGVWPEHPSFSDQQDFSDAPGSSGKQNLAYGPPPPDWHGDCVSGEQWSQDDCNNKLIGARFYRLGAGAATVITDEYLSPRDRDGHGTHTASTAGGNAGVEASILGSELGTISGMAPRARIAAYKVCWNDAGCFVSDIVSAIDDAVADGVDVVNFSIGSSATTLGPDDIAFLFAADAGVYVATSAGNTGPGSGTIGSPTWVPWITAVGATTQDRTFASEVTTGDAATYSGLGLGVTDELRLVDAEDAGDELCNIGALDPGVVSGNIVLCKRGAIPLVNKSQAVLLAGGAGMVLYNQNASLTPYLTSHAVPTAHIEHGDGMAIKGYIDAAGEDASASINGGHAESRPAPWMVDFSSRGPNGGAGDIIKPDIVAPGFGILAGYTPNPFVGAPGELFAVIQGTSMSSPHVAGAFALLKDAHPDWSPAMAKSAIMTTADQGVVKEDGVTPADLFDMGAGHLTPNPAADPGLVYHAGFLDYLAFLCGNNPANISSALCGLLGSLGYSFDPSDLNLASIGIAELAGFQTITRTVTNVGSSGTYNVSVSPPPGIAVLVSPASLTLGTGESASYSVTFTTTSSATLDHWAFGSLTWSDGGHNVYSPIAVVPVALAAPGEVAGEGQDGSLEYDVTFGYSGDFSAEPHGLIPADTVDDTVVDDPANDINAALATDVGINIHEVVIPGGTEYARFSLFDEYTDGNDDLDLYVFGPDTAGFPFAGGSGSPTSAEEVNLVAPDPGTYLVIVHGWQTDGPEANYTLFSWLLSEADAGNMNVTAPGTAVLGGFGTITVAWTGLSPDTKYLGAVTYHDIAAPGGYNDSQVGVTVVRVDTD